MNSRLLVEQYANLVETEPYDLQTSGAIYIYQLDGDDTFYVSRYKPLVVAARPPSPTISVTGH